MADSRCRVVGCELAVDIPGETSADQFCKDHTDPDTRIQAPFSGLWKPTENYQHCKILQYNETERDGNAGI